LPNIAQTAGIVVTNPTKGEGSSDRLSLLCAEPVRKKKRDPGANHSACSDNEREFWPAKLDFIEDNTNR
jgi:hypothetical protein